MKFRLATLTDYSDEALLAELRLVADELGGARLTQAAFNEHSRVHSTTLRARFGSWEAALDSAAVPEEIAPRKRPLQREQLIEAIRRFTTVRPNDEVTRDAVAASLGVDPGTISRKFGRWEALLAELNISPAALGRRYTDNECYENILALWTRYGRQPHFAELNQPPSEVGSKAYVRRWSGWRAALAAFVELANLPEVQPEASSSFAAPSISQTEHVNDVAAISRGISLSLRYRVLCRDHFRCVICGATPATEVGVTLHIDHIVPWSKGGKNTEENLRTLCLRCNLGKGARIEFPSDQPKAVPTIETPYDA